MDLIVQRFLDENGKIKQLPAKQTMKELVYDYLAEKFSNDVMYTESDVNSIINQWHTFGDYFILRRGLIDSGLLNRLPDGSKYWKHKKEEQEL